ncbi:hypothetical protein ACQZV8_20415, partial [Magnetococcales bacterium HHB-1]
RRGRVFMRQNRITLLMITMMVSGLFLFQGDLEAFQRRDRVLGQWSDGLWYPATINGYRSGYYSVAFDDGDVARLAPAKVRRIYWGSGTRVQCNWKGRGKYYRGVIATKHGNHVMINYDDGDRENTVIGRCRSSSGGGSVQQRQRVPNHVRESASGVPSDPMEFLKAIERNTR